MKTASFYLAVTLALTTAVAMAKVPIGDLHNGSSTTSFVRAGNSLIVTLGNGRYPVEQYGVAFCNISKATVAGHTLTLEASGPEIARSVTFSPAKISFDPHKLRSLNLPFDVSESGAASEIAKRLVRDRACN